jgi:hypothetical protein
MRHLFCLLLIIIASIQSLHSQILTEKQKIEDFNYLYNTLKDNYPYFGVYERAKGVNWLNYHDKFLEYVKYSTTDSLFFITIHSLIKSLACDHLDISPSYSKSYYSQIYSHENKERARWCTELKKGTDRWEKMFNKQKSNESSTQNESNVPYYDTTNVELKIIEKNKIAVLKIKSFEGEYLEKDKLKIASLFDSITEYSNIIIDIQGNGGGSSLYWSNCLVPLMIDKQLDNKVYLAIKNGKLNRSYYKSIGMKPDKLDALKGFEYVPDEIFDEIFSIFVTVDQIVPEKNKKCKGKFYLLVDKDVFSASEGMAIFCKATKCATVAGEKTGGDGIGIDPFLVCLPNSKIVIRYPGEMGLNSDGSSNFEMKTKPDIKIVADNNEERLQRLIEYIRKH